MQSQTVELLYKIRKRLAKHWTKGTLAKDGEGNEVTSLDPTACKWCMLGAIEKECVFIDDKALKHNLKKVLVSVVEDEFAEMDDEDDLDDAIIDFNDTKNRKLEEILGRIDLAIQKASNSNVV